MSDLPPPPPPPAPPALDPAFVADATVTATDVSVWFGQKVALSELSCSFGPGVTGLLGPNGAGKTTLMRAITGLIPVNLGQVHVAGRSPRADREVYRQLALVPEDEAVPRGLTPRQLCRYVADLHGLTDPNVVDWALQTVDMVPAADRSMDGFSKGMRQRSKVAAALVKNPLVLVLDEPLNGADPVQRLRLIELFRRLGAEGRTVIVSSHVLNEVESMADRVIVVVRGRLAAAGGHRAIRDAMDDVPRHVLVRAPGRAAAGQRPARERGRVGHQRGRRRPDHLHHAGQGARRAPAAGRARPRRPPHRGPPPRRLAREPVPGARAMTDTVTTARRRRPAMVALVVYTLQACLPGKRWIGALVPASAAILFGFIASTIDDTAARAFADVAADSLFGLVMPVTCLVIGDAVLGSEVRSGTFTFTWMSPVPTWQITLARWLGGSLASAGVLAIAFALAAVVAGDSGSAGAIALAAVFGAQAYVAVFLAIGCITKRAAVWSLAFVFIVERLLGANLSGIAQLTPSWVARSAFVGLTDAQESLVREGIPHGTGALIRLCFISAVALILTSTKLRSLKLTGSSD